MELFVVYKQLFSKFGRKKLSIFCTKGLWVYPRTSHNHSLLQFLLPIKTSNFRLRCLVVAPTCRYPPPTVLLIWVFSSQIVVQAFHSSFHDTFNLPGSLNHFPRVRQLSPNHLLSPLDFTYFVSFVNCEFVFVFCNILFVPRLIMLC